MGNQFASGKNSIAQCDRCDQRYKLTQLKIETIKVHPYRIKVCPECWDPDHPQLQLGMFPVDDPQAVREPRPDLSYRTSGVNVDGYSSQGSRDIQWNWNPIGMAMGVDAALTPNYLVALDSVGQVGISNIYVPPPPPVPDYLITQSELFIETLSGQLLVTDS